MTPLNSISMLYLLDPKNVPTSYFTKQRDRAILKMILESTIWKYIKGLFTSSGFEYRMQFKAESCGIIGFPR